MDDLEAGWRWDPEARVEGLEVVADRGRSEGVDDRDGPVGPVLVLRVERSEVVGLTDLRGRIARRARGTLALLSGGGLPALRDVDARPQHRPDSEDRHG